MSALTQEDLRRLMREKMKQPSSSVPQDQYAKTTSSGKIICMLCPGVPIKHWVTHRTSAQHKRNLTAHKQAESMPAPPPPPPKAARSPLKVPAPPKEAPKSILKNPLKNAAVQKVESEIITPPNKEATKRPASPTEEESEAKMAKIETAEESSTLPEGFFDDPKLDAKARNIEYKDPQEAEWEMFQKELREEDNKSDQVVEIDEEKEMRERELYETDEMISKWQTVRELELQKEQLQRVENNDSNSDMDDDGEQAGTFEEFLNWRQKSVQ